MKRALLIALALLGLVSHGAVTAAPGNCTDNGVLNPMGFETLTVSTTAVPLTSSVYAPSGQTPAALAVVTIAAQNIRYRDDGVSPSDTVGHIGIATTALTVCGQMTIQRIQFIRDDASDATLSVSYYRAGS